MRAARLRRPRSRQLLAGAVSTALAAGALMLLPGTVEAAPPSAGLVLSYDLTAGSGSTVTDLSGNGRNGTIVGGATYVGGSLVLDGVDDHVRLPNNLMQGLSSITVSADVLVDATQGGNYFLWGLGNPATGAGTGSGYLAATGNTFRAFITNQWYNNEDNTAPNPGRTLARGVFKTVTYTQTGTTGVLYEDGVEVGRKTNVRWLPSQIGNGTTTNNVLGESNYAADNTLKGKLRSFQVYDRALSVDEVRTLAPSDGEQVAGDQASLDLGDLSMVTENLTLPTSGPRGSTISWVSSASATVSSTGVVTRPAPGSAAATVTLTATLTRGAATATRTFSVTVPALPTVQERAEAAAAALEVVDPGDVRGNLTLPTAGASGATVTWASSAPAVVSATGIVRRPSTGSADATVTLTATVTVESATVTKRFALTVKALPVTEPYAGYAFSYFKDNSVAGEKIYFAASRGNNALQWDELNGGQPSFESPLGRKGLRDPFLIRSPEGDTFYLLATDLSVGRGDGFDQRTGSRYLEVWESRDLVNWGKQRHVLVSPPTAGNTWAPEAFWDEASQSYVVYWASRLYPESDPAHASASWNRMMIATTRDFRTFTPPTVWQDPSGTTSTERIDATVIKVGDTYHRFTKDEGSKQTGCLDLIHEKSTSLTAPTVPGNASWSFVDSCIGKKAGTASVEGPTIFQTNEGDTSGKKYWLFADEFANRGYLPLGTDSLDGTPTWTIPTSYTLPRSPRHGTVIPVTAAELARLRGTTPYAAPGDPSAPSLTAVTEDGATATWTAPTITNSSAVTGYRVQVLQGQQVVSTQEVTATTVTLTGLDPAQRYTVRVEARNAAGYGAPSAATALTTAEATTPPVVTPPVVNPPVVTPPVVASPLPPVQGPQLRALNGVVKGAKSVRVGKKIKIVITTAAATGVVVVKAAGRKKSVTIRNGRGVVKIRFTQPGKQEVVLRTAGAKQVLKVRVRR